MDLLKIEVIKSHKYYQMQKVDLLNHKSRTSQRKLDIWDLHKLKNAKERQRLPSRLPSLPQCFWVVTE